MHDCESFSRLSKEISEKIHQIRLMDYYARYIYVILFKRLLDNYIFGILLSYKVSHFVDNNIFIILIR